MSASRLRTVSNVWPPWLPGALTGVENHLLASQTAPPPLLSMASFKTLSTTSISSPKPIPRVARPNRLLRSAATLPNYASIPSALFQPQPQHKNRQIRLFHQHSQQSNINKQSREFETAAQSVKPQTSAYEPAESNSVPIWAPPASLEDRPVCIIGAGVLALNSSRAFIAGELATYCAENGTQPGHVSFSSTLEDAVQNAWMVIEAVPEDLEVKISLLGQLDRIVAKDVVIATNSEGFRSQELVGEVSNKERVLNTLYYIPPKNKCVEMMSCGYTSPSVILFLAGEMKGMGLKPIAVPGGGNMSMIFPRIWSAVKKETLKILSEGQADPEEVDVLFRDFFGLEKGVCEMMDEVGLDTVLKSEKSRLPNTRGSDCFWGAKGEEHVEWLQREFVGKGKLGLKTGEGLIVKRRRSVKGKKAKDSAGQEAWEKHSVDVCGL
ncbi:uncharacterized protein RAG0_00008 [Rhynchosporium agropyri]|uniref:3-hydroxyacyl-CoA dehydrogenase NAD binding domain-containing protein n=1 Tax=Rhynchosporium agropyri TaxID=914238 RepID=A0A1E1JRM1_9HELO|nr:uncharacterized protein RAG0_00008 [Rhynchosporium agropyri]